jgi:hypothetical protein
MFDHPQLQSRASSNRERAKDVAAGSNEGKE